MLNKKDAVFCFDFYVLWRLPFSYLARKYLNSHEKFHGNDFHGFLRSLFFHIFLRKKKSVFRKIVLMFSNSLIVKINKN